MHQDDSGPAPAVQADPGRTPEADAAVRYWDGGLRPVLLTPIGSPICRPGRGVGPSDGKVPIEAGWAYKAYADVEEIYEAYYRAHPGAGVGLAPEGSPHNARVGPWEPCGLVDLEEDDPGAAAATLAAIFGAAGPPECGWRSARGTHRAFILYERQARWLLDAGIDQATLDGKYHECLAGLELRLGTLDPARPKQAQSVAPPTRTLNKDGTTSEPRRMVVRENWFLPMPERLVNYLIRHLGDSAKVAAQRAKAADRMAAPRPVVVAGHLILILPAAAAGPIPREELAGLDPLDRVELALDRLGTPPDWRPGERHFVARCPAHPSRSGRSDNLDAREAEDGTLLITCYVGCGFGEVMEALGLREADAYLEFRRTVAARGGRRRSNVDAPTGPAAVTDEEADAWEEEQDRYAAELDARPGRRAELAARLGLPPEALDVLRFGWKERNAAGKDGAGDWVPLGPAWTWPEHDHRGRVVGINRRFVDPAAGKKFIGSRRADGEGGPVTHLAKRGLVYPVADFRARPGPVWVVEGESDALALAYRSAAVVGRPGNKSGADEVALLLAGDPRDVVVLGENDRKEDGTWPGDPVPFAGELARRLRRAVGRQLPPEGCKDAREYVIRLIAAEGKPPG